MKSIIFSRTCTFKGKDFLVGDKLKKFKKEDLADIWVLNEKGFIEPLSEADFREIITKKFEIKNKEEHNERSIT